MRKTESKKSSRRRGTEKASDRACDIEKRRAWDGSDRFFWRVVTQEDPKNLSSTHRSIVSISSRPSAARAAKIAPFAPSRAARLTSSRVRSSSRSSPRHPGSRFPQSVSTMAAQCAAARAQFAAPAAIKRGARARARGAAGRSQTRLGGRGVILASTGGGAPADADVVRAPRPEYIPNKIDDPNYVRVFDTTLRDGEQSPGTNPTRRFDHPRDPRIRHASPVVNPDDCVGRLRASSREPPISRFRLSADVCRFRNNQTKPAFRRQARR